MTRFRLRSVGSSSGTYSKKSDATAAADEAPDRDHVAEEVASLALQGGVGPVRGVEASRTELPSCLETVDVQHNEAGKVGKLEESEGVGESPAANEGDDSVGNADTPTNEEEENHDIEFLVHIDLVILVI